MGAGGWLTGMVQSMFTNEKYMNAYDTGLPGFPMATTSVEDGLAQVDCWFGGLIALGIGPQMTTDPVSAKKMPLAAFVPRVRFWNTMYARYGHASVDHISVLAGLDECSIYGCGKSFLLELRCGHCVNYY